MQEIKDAYVIPGKDSWTTEIVNTIVEAVQTQLKALLLELDIAITVISNHLERSSVSERERRIIDKIRSQRLFVPHATDDIDEDAIKHMDKKYDTHHSVFGLNNNGSFVSLARGYENRTIVLKRSDWSREVMQFADNAPGRDDIIRSNIGAPGSNRPAFMEIAPKSLYHTIGLANVKRFYNDGSQAIYTCFANSAMQMLGAVALDPRWSPLTRLIVGPLYKRDYYRSGTCALADALPDRSTYLADPSMGQDPVIASIIEVLQYMHSGQVARANYAMQRLLDYSEGLYYPIPPLNTEFLDRRYRLQASELKPAESAEHVPGQQQDSASFLLPILDRLSARFPSILRSRFTLVESRLIPEHDYNGRTDAIKHVILCLDFNKYNSIDQLAKLEHFQDFLDPVKYNLDEIPKWSAEMRSKVAGKSILINVPEFTEVRQGAIGDEKKMHGKLADRLKIRELNRNLKATHACVMLQTLDEFENTHLFKFLYGDIIGFGTNMRLLELPSTSRAAKIDAKDDAVRQAQYLDLILKHEYATETTLSPSLLGAGLGSLKIDPHTSISLEKVLQQTSGDIKENHPLKKTCEYCERSNMATKWSIVRTSSYRVGASGATAPIRTALKPTDDGTSTMYQNEIAFITIPAHRQPIELPRYIKSSDLFPGDRLAASRERIYQLGGVAYHVGSESKGHYYAIVKNPEMKTRWLNVNDSTVTSWHYKNAKAYLKKRSNQMQQTLCLYTVIQETEQEKAARRAHELREQEEEARTAREAVEAVEAFEAFESKRS